MNTKTKVILDEWLGRSLVFFLNLSARLLGQILNIDHGFEKIPQRIVICKFLGMGSIIQATPLIQSLRRSFPNAEICFITSRSNVSLLENIPAINTIWHVDDRGFLSVLASTWNVLRQLWKNKADLYIDLETYSYYSTAVATLSMARNRLGFYRVERNIRMGVYTHMMFFNSRAPIAQSYLQMARLTGCRELTEQLYPFTIKEEARISMHEKLSAMGCKASDKYVVVNCNASDLRIERRWPSGNFVALLEELTKEFHDHRFLLIGSADERGWVESVYTQLSPTAKLKSINTAGQFTLNELFALINGSLLTITNDTGPMHISFALQKPTVCLFGPASPSQYGQNKWAYGFYKNIYCSPCVHDFLTPPCNGNNQCMQLIRVDEVAALCKRLLSGEKTDAREFVKPEMQYTLAGGFTTLGLVERS